MTEPREHQEHHKDKVQHHIGEDVLAPELVSKLLLEAYEIPLVHLGRMLSLRESPEQAKLNTSMETQRLFTDANHKLHHKGIASDLQIVGSDPNWHLLLADWSKGQNHRVYPVGPKGTITDICHFKEPGHELVFDHLERSKYKVQEERGVSIEKKAGKFEYHLKANGKDEVVLTAESSEQGVKSADQFLSALAKERKEQLAKIFGIQIVDAGQDATSKEDVSAPNGKRNVKAREPRLDELAGLEAALYRSQPSQLSVDGSPLNFYYLAEKTLGDLAYKCEDLEGKNSIFIEEGLPGDWHRPATMNDSTKHCIESVLTHELGHMSQVRMGWHGQAGNRVARMMGWQPHADDKSESWDQGELLGDKMGHFFYHSGHSDKWMSCNQFGQSGTLLSWLLGRKQDPSLNNEQMMKRALVKPMSEYFPNSTEMHAEGILYFRLGGTWRSKFLQQSPEFYKLIKEQDQIEIDGAYGQGKYLRLPNGYLSNNTEINRKAIFDFEHQK